MEKPMLTVGIPLYNEGEYISDTLNSLLGQSLKNFEIVICDDSSTDNSENICRSFARGDGRIRYYRNKNNLGEIDNFNKVLGLAKGKYFMWAGGHDLWDKKFEEVCVSVLENNTLAVACFPWKEDIDINGKSLGIYETKPDTRAKNKLARMLAAIWTLNDSVLVGVIRTNELRKTRRYQYVSGPDHVIRVELAMKGEFVVVPQVLMKLRHQREESYRRAYYRRVRNWKLKERRGWFYVWLPHWAMLKEMLVGVSRNCKNILEISIYIPAALVAGLIRFSRLLVIFDAKVFLKKAIHSADV